MFLRRLILFLAIVLLALPALILVTLAASDLAPARGLIESVASELVGHDVTINGNTVFDVVPQPRLAASAVMIEDVGEIASLDLVPSLAGWRLRLDGTISAKTIDLRPFLTPTGGGKPESKQHPLFSDQPLPLSGLRRIDGRLRLTASRLVLAHGDVQAVNVTATLDHGRLDLDPLAAQVAGGSMAGRAALDASGDVPTAALAVNGQRLAADQLLALAGKPGMVTAPIDVATDLRSTGASPAALAAGLGGDAALTAGAGRIVVQNLGQLREVLRQAGLIDQALQLTCAAVDLKAQAGVLTPNVAVLQTQYGRATLSGRIDLGRESLDLALVPSVTAAGFDLGLPIDVKGPLQQPTYAIDRSAAARRLVGLLPDGGASPTAEGSIDGLGASARACLAAGKAGPSGSSPRKDLDGLIKKGIKNLLGK